MKTINDVPKGIKRKIYNSIGIIYMMTINHIPSRRIRRFFYSLAGAHIAKNGVVFRNVDLLWPMGFSLGNGSSIGWHCLIDARGGIEIGQNVTVASKVNLITGSHDIEDKNFSSCFEHIVIDDYAWICTGAVILQGVKIGRGAVVCAGAVVTKDVEPMSIIAGVPGKPIGKRKENPVFNNGKAPIMH